MLEVMDPSQERNGYGRVELRPGHEQGVDALVGQGPVDLARGPWLHAEATSRSPDVAVHDARVGQLHDLVGQVAVRVVPAGAFRRWDEHDDAGTAAVVELAQSDEEVPVVVGAGGPTGIHDVVERDAHR